MIILSDRAGASIDHISDYLAQQGGIDLGARFIEAAFKTFDVLEARPGVGTEFEAGSPSLKGI